MPPNLEHRSVRNVFVAYTIRKPYFFPNVVLLNPLHALTKTNCSSGVLLPINLSHFNVKLRSDIFYRNMDVARGGR